MIKNHFKNACRSLNRQRFYAALNVLGLAVGLASCLVITLYIADELRYDRFAEHSDRLYRVDADIKFGAEAVQMTTVPAPWATVLINEYPQVEAATRIRKLPRGKVIRRPDQATGQRETRVVFADSSFFTVFPLPVLAGDVNSALSEPNTVVLTADAAKKFFGSEPPVNQSILVDNQVIYRVSAVVANLPSQSHLSGITMFLSMSSFSDLQETDWITHKFHTYMRLQPGVQAADFGKNLDAIIEKHVNNALEQNFGISVAQFRESGNRLRYSLFPVKDIHLHSHKTDEIGVNSDVRYVYIFSAAAVFLLIIACVNFMNLATARAAGRAREVGIRKIIGSARWPLIVQFLTEAALLSYLAMGLATAIAAVSLPFFNDLAGKQITLPYQTPLFWFLLLLTGTGVGLLAGSYPAFFLSGFKPLRMLKGNSGFAGQSPALRNALVVFQFTVSVILLAGTAVIFYQLRYIRAKQLGFDKEQVLVVSDAYPLGNRANVFKQEVLSLASVESMSWSGYLPTPSDRRYDAFFPKGDKTGANGINMQSWWVDEDYVTALGLQLLEGRNFTPDFPTDSSAIIFNETAVRLLGIDHPVGQEVTGLVDIQQERSFTVVGVVKDFHFESLRDNIAPLALLLRPHTGGAAVRLSGGDIQQTVHQIEAIWKRYVPEQPLSYHFMDDAFNQTYRTEQQMGRIFAIFASLSVFIASLGLFGLATFTAERRTKEIGIRKALGASVFRLVRLLSSDFLKLVGIAILIATPVTWWAMNKWLEDFAYRIDIQWWMFAGAGLAAAVIAVLTVSWQAIRAAGANPVESLHTE